MWSTFLRWDITKGTDTKINQLQMDVNIQNMGNITEVTGWILTTVPERVEHVGQEHWKKLKYQSTHQGEQTTWDVVPWEAESKQKYHRQKIFPSCWNTLVRVDPLHQSHQRHPGGRLLQAWP